ncbi:hypothetical protein EHS25_004624 [Saitozyma podzolica]|uniref:Uncharacterized protein n=1 Tax=Saitozyma podzolica TaxID=1890683 RepID=A0A427YUK3_9TREE|nr:hypothetical protein EHS25_004624 [Saitozyma podzolica]
MMFSKLLVPVALAASALAQTFSINTPPSLVQCQPGQISWVGGTSPFILAAIPAGQTSAAAIETISSSLTASPYTWTVNLASGTNITLKLTDADGNLAYSSPIVIQAGTSTSCLNASASTSGLSTAAVTTTGSSSASGSAVVSSSAAASSAVTSSTSKAASSASSAASSAASAAGSAASAASSAAASATSKSGALATAVAGLPALAAGLIGGVAVLL